MVKKYNSANAFQNIMLYSGKKTKKELRLIKKFPYSDFDGDKYINSADCRPANKNRDVWYDPRTWPIFQPPVPQVGAPVITPSEAVAGAKGIVVTGTPMAQVPSAPVPSGGVVGGVPSGAGGVPGQPTTQKTEVEGGIITKSMDIYGNLPYWFYTSQPQPIGTHEAYLKTLDKQKLKLGEISTKTPSGVVSVYDKPFKQDIKMKLYEKYYKLKTEPIKTLKGYGTGALAGFWNVVYNVPATAFKESLTPVQYEKLKKGVYEEYKYEPYPTKKTLETTKVIGMTEAEKEGLVYGYSKYAVEVKTSQINRELLTESKNISDKEYNKYLDKQNEIQMLINQEKISYEEGNSRNTKAFEEFNKNYNEQFTPIYKQKVKEAEEYGEEISKKYAFKQALVELPIYAGIGFGLGVIGGVSKTAGTAIGVLGATSLAINLPEITAPILQKDVYTLGTLGVTTAAFVGGGIAGARIGSGVKAKYVEEVKINEAIKNSKVVTKIPRDVTSTSKLKEIGIDLNGNKYFKDYIDKGYTLREYTSKLVSTNTATSKYLPKVEGHYIEVLGRNGEVIERISLGKVLIDYKGKVYSRNTISNAIGKIEGDTAKYYSRNIVLETTKKGKAVQYLEFLEESKLTKLEKEKWGRKIKGEAKIDILKEVEKPKLKDITQLETIGKPTPKSVGKIFENLVGGKEYGRADILYRQKIRKGKIKIVKGAGDTTQFLIGSKMIDTGKGVAVFKRTYPKVKTKMSRFFIEEPKYKTPKIKPTKSYISQKLEMPEPLRMEAYTKAFL